MSGRSLTRRTFLGGAAAAPLVLPSVVLGLDGATAPSNRVIYGYVGCGYHGLGWNFPQVFRCGDAQVIAVCDVDKGHLKEGKTSVDRHYSSRFGKEYKGCATHADFRDLIHRRDIDVVGIATPDHWHVIPAIMAAKAGKDVICEKPLTLTVAEGRVLSDVIKQTGRIFQTASENRSIDVYIRLTELIRSGVVGKLKHIEVRVPLGNTNARVGAEGQRLFEMRTPEDPPKELNYEMWLGQAPLMPYIPARVHRNFRWNRAFSGGVITDWGAHMVDLAQWGHNSEHSGPVTVVGKGDFPPPDSIYNTAATFVVNYQYADGVTLTLSSGQGDLDPRKHHDGPIVGRTSSPGIRFEGSEGWIEVHGWRGSLKASRRSMLDATVDRDAVKVYRPSEVVDRRDGGKGGEHRNFLDCVKSRTPCYAPAETGHRTITIPHIGNIAMLLGRKLRWNPEAERFVDDAEADKMLARNQRQPWTIDNIESWIKENS